MSCPPVSDVWFNINHEVGYSLALEMFVVSPHMSPDIVHDGEGSGDVPTLRSEILLTSRGSIRLRAHRR